MDNENLKEQIEKYIKDTWNTDKTISLINSEVYAFLNNLRDSNFITIREYDSFIKYNALFNDKKTMEKVSENSTLKELHNIYNHIETIECRTELLSKVMSIIKSSNEW